MEHRALTIVIIIFFNYCSAMEQSNQINTQEINFFIKVPDDIIRQIIYSLVDPLYTKNMLHHIEVFSKTNKFYNSLINTLCCNNDNDAQNFKKHVIALRHKQYFREHEIYSMTRLGTFGAIWLKKELEVNYCQEIWDLKRMNEFKKILGIQQFPVIQSHRGKGCFNKETGDFASGLKNFPLRTRIILKHFLCERLTISKLNQKNLNVSDVFDNELKKMQEEKTTLPEKFFLSSIVDNKKMS